MKVIWVLVMLVAGTFWIRRDVAEYRHFVRFEESTLRQRAYGRWITTSFTLLTFASIVSLWLAGGLDPFDSFPAAFEPLQDRLQLPDRPVTPAMLFGVAIGVSINLVLFIVIQRWRNRPAAVQAQGLSPDGVDAIIPRNGRESLCGIALSINAGFSEELFFRLALPLLLFQITGSLSLSFALALLCFGLAHAYQGVRGVLATMLAGGMLTFVYLRTGSLLHVMVLHAAIDIVALFVRPRIARIAHRIRIPIRRGKQAHAITP